VSLRGDGPIPDYTRPKPDTPKNRPKPDTPKHRPKPDTPKQGFNRTIAHTPVFVLVY
jgi:hypothetical protein